MNPATHLTNCLGTFVDGEGIVRACRIAGPHVSDYEEEQGLIEILYCVNGERIRATIRPFEFTPDPEF